MRRSTLVVIAVALVAMPRVVHADKRDPVAVAHAWIDAIKADDRRALATLSAIPLTIASAVNNDGSFVSCMRHQVTSRAGFAKVVQMKGLVELDPTHDPSAISGVFDCLQPKGQRRIRPMPVPRPAGAHDVAFKSMGTVLVIRISKSGKVMSASQITNSGGN